MQVIHIIITFVLQVIFNISWSLLIRSYRQINSAKYKVIGEIEKQLHDPELFKDQDEAKQKTREFDDLNSNLLLMYKRWDDLTEYLNKPSP